MALPVCNALQDRNCANDRLLCGLAFMNGLNWIAFDWGTSCLRVWLMSPSNEVLACAESDQGMSKLTPDGFEPALQMLVQPWLSEDSRMVAVGCGMVGSRQGWVEVPYIEAPCSPLGPLTRAPISSDVLKVFITPGVMQKSPADVMRGEETQIAGLLAQRGDFEGVVCLPGTHSKWVRVSGGKILSFQTFVTGELFTLLAEQSVLRFSVSSEGWDDDAFLYAVGVGIRDPVSIFSRVFSLRAETLLEDLDGSVARAKLSGYLLGVELAATRDYWQGSSVALLGSERSSIVYAAGLKAQGCEAEVLDGESLTLAGLHAACSLR